MIYIYHNGEKIRFENADDAIDFLQKSKQELFKKEVSRDCNKCVWQYSISCPGDSKHCNSYKRDAPDGGYYG